MLRQVNKEMHNGNLVKKSLTQMSMLMYRQQQSAGWIEMERIREENKDEMEQENWDKSRGKCKPHLNMLAIYCIRQVSIEPVYILLPSVPQCFQES